MTEFVRAADPADAVLRRAFVPWHKRALGLAVGLTAGFVTFGVTLFHVLVAPSAAPNIELLAQFFYGYDVSWTGALIGAWWSFVVGFTAGWFVAFLVNFSTATWLLVVKVKHDLSRTTDFLDHI